jgi:hypothetical protein
MLAGAILSASGGVLAWFTISDDVLERAEEPGREPCLEALETAPEFHCAVAGTPIQSATRGEPSVQPAQEVLLGAEVKG